MTDLSNIALSCSDLSVVITAGCLQTLINGAGDPEQFSAAFDSAGYIGPYGTAGATLQFMGTFAASAATLNLPPLQYTVALTDATALVNGTTYTTSAGDWSLVFSINDFTLPSVPLTDAPAPISTSAVVEWINECQVQGEVANYGFSFTNSTLLPQTPLPSGWVAADWTAMLAALGTYLTGTAAPAWQVDVMSCVVVPTTGIAMVPAYTAAQAFGEPGVLVVAMNLTEPLGDFSPDYMSLSYSNGPQLNAVAYALMSSAMINGFLGAGAAGNSPVISQLNIQPIGVEGQNLTVTWSTDTGNGVALVQPPPSSYVFEISGSNETTSVTSYGSGMDRPRWRPSWGTAGPTTTANRWR